MTWGPNIALLETIQPQRLSGPSMHVRYTKLATTPISFVDTLLSNTFARETQRILPTFEH